ncbi:DUF3179 domain-containing protein [Candidatus Woesearchaeota archaeon]|jgi:hypothetical protein|nr:DUF3179 domain-containing protein [Candidatus Woesearchaeota archaeon]MBT4595807.1 DUF3179 domain-containing protein [Candidatus Woesearchaeota archaeon]MBT5741344.1 DUF3179 domain-containing protein [Candidatus Woesearchaeota archaeon]MBT6505396.1 DUF3179 domain-containing protein [Candidatus Woesearchaeota archaeon]MBT7297084.1 DUF3179 domain-containing protein [Candidatus Woesearchaeota archaeon]
MKLKNKFILLFCIIVFGSFILNLFFNSSNDLINENKINGDSKLNNKFWDFNAINNSLNYDIKIDYNGIKYIIDPSKIKKGIAKPGDVKDIIPSIDNPKYQKINEVDWIGDDELVLAIHYKGKKKVYPLQILVWHEIVNDFIDGDPILITYCPLCGSGIAYHRVIDGNAVEFGTSGKLFNSNLVMYDRLTKSYWQQIDGNAIVGELTGFELKEINIDTVVWFDYKNNNDDAIVLTRDTGAQRNYGVDPYGSYYSDSFLIFDVENEDDRIHPKTPIWGVEINGVTKAYKESDVKEVGFIIDNIAGVDIKIEMNDDGTSNIINLNDNTKIVKERDFWFAWYAFNPETKLYNIE